MSKTLIVGNWKMYHNTHQASLLLHHLSDKVKIRQDVEVVLCPNYLVLQSLSLQVNHRQFKLGAQNCNWHDEGAYTGEVSATMLSGLTQYVIVGHSERRHIFGEHDIDIRKKVQAVIRNNMKPILCIGETALERTDGETRHVLHDQLVSGLANVTSEEVATIAIAYEPVWAIGTGKNANPIDVKEVVVLIRKQITSLYGKEAADAVQVLYGGSVSGSNVADYLAIKGVNGLLVGGASLQADEFATITAAAHKNSEEIEG